MQISYGTHAGGLETSQGYGYAGINIINSLQALGHTTPFNYAKAPIQFDFTQPFYYQFSPDQYNIGYTPWESTGLMDGWSDSMNSVDEIWTTSDWCKNVFEKAGVTSKIFVYPHGIEHIWKPFRRVKGTQLRFLHVGEPAPRKCGQMVFDAFTELFGNDNRYQLTIKANGVNTVRAHLPSGEIDDPMNMYKNVNVIKTVLPIEELVSLYNSHHALVYPSYGEGFGFIPLQAMASGMPTIFNPTWAPYRNFSVGLEIEDRLIDSLWPEIHPGQVLEPSYESLLKQMQNTADYFDSYADQAYDNAPAIHEEYDWLRVTEKAFQHVVSRFS